MKSIRTEITIHAPAKIVWDILMDFDHYPAWNPFMQIKGNANQGNRLEVTITLDGHKPQIFNPEILELIPEKSFRWLGHFIIKGLFDGEHLFNLEAVGENETLLIHGENFTGMLSGLILNMIEEKTMAGFEKMNTALKQEAERQFAVISKSEAG